MMLFRLTTAACLLGLATSAQAFCGLYVARADGELFNEASKVIYAREGDASAITMASDYHGEPSDFAMIVPTPSVLERRQIRTVQTATMDHLDAYSAPRLVEYNDPDPCEPQIMYSDAPVESLGVNETAQIQRRRGPAALGVKIEARYAVGEYDIVMLSARQSDGLETWLLQEGYNIPDGASPTLGRYIDMGMKFFVARVNLDRHAAGDTANLAPLQIRFTSADFMLPIQLGMVNARGPQDLILLTLTREGRVETANYAVEEIPSNVNIPIFVRKEFPDFYTSMFDQVMEKRGGSGVMLEYAWDMTWCDPCAADPLTFKELRELGVGWTLPDQQAPEVFVTRLHMRYDAESFTEDLMLRETSNRANFQGRYVMQNPWSEPFECDASHYVKQVRNRVNAEAETLQDLTGWSRQRIRENALQSLPDQYK